MKDDREWEAKDSGADEKSNKEWDRGSSHSWLTSSILTEAEFLQTWDQEFLKKTPSKTIRESHGVKTSQHIKRLKKFQNLSVVIFNSAHAQNTEPVSCGKWWQIYLLI